MGPLPAVWHEQGQFTFGALRAWGMTTDTFSLEVRSPRIKAGKMPISLGMLPYRADAVLECHPVMGSKAPP